MFAPGADAFVDDGRLLTWLRPEGSDWQPWAQWVSGWCDEIVLGPVEQIDQELAIATDAAAARGVALAFTGRLRHLPAGWGPERTRAVIGELAAIAVLVAPTVLPVLAALRDAVRTADDRGLGIAIVSR